ncbi:carbohydrate kinase family protein [Corynebacterium variabile]|uniref:carbohydrate kinase family protein n=1 Tax=Corynebacterium variabile TaxID=1727 RepID=UPI003FD4F317
MESISGHNAWVKGTGHPPTAPHPQVHLVGGFSLDAALYPDGSAQTGRLGGNALWATLGALAAGVRPVAHSVVGQSYPSDALSELTAAGVDVSGVRRGSSPTGLRVSYSYAADGTRTQPADPSALAVLAPEVRARFLDTTRRGEGDRDTLPTTQDLRLPDTGENAGTAAEAPEPGFWHLGLLPLNRCTELAGHLAARGHHVQADCPARNELRAVGTGPLAQLLPHLDTFLPSTSDTEVFCPGSSPAELITGFHRLGARSVVLKCGDQGGLVSEAPGATVWRIPIYPEPHAGDPTGCGDVFAGAFLAARARDRPLLDAACLGAAAASLATTAREPLDLVTVDPSEVLRRARLLRKDITAS